MALARASADAALKQYYEELALKFVRNVGGERDLDRLSVPNPPQPPASSLARSDF